MDKLEFKVFFYAIGDYSRFSILDALEKKDLNVSEIVAITGIEQSNVSHHLHCLLNCGFVKVRKDGKERIYSINTEVKQTVRSIIKHINYYKTQIISCDIANKEYISRVVK
ncbi:MAG: metalloregulator ArsR/SmtB family transcription factor [Candidatus Marsarchaeota archaeon]|nr:metalloregulator ArsR/SmtB family transcription factor [Candidatus Marsarchaeota archaeon]